MTRNKRLIFQGFVLGLALLAAAGCSSIDAGGTINENPAALNGDYSGKDFSGTVAMVPDDSNIPGVAASVGQEPRWSDLDRAQFLHIDAHCQKWLFTQLPGWAQAIAKESGWGALATAVGEAGFAAAFPGASMVRYFLAGLGYGLPSWANNGRVRQDQAEKSSQGYCNVLKVYRAQERYHILQGWDAIPWSGPGHTMLPPATDSDNKKPLPYVKGSRPPMLPH